MSRPVFLKNIRESETHKVVTIQYYAGVNLSELENH